MNVIPYNPVAGLPYQTPSDKAQDQFLRILTEGGATPDERITFAYRATLSRSPRPEELAIVILLLSDKLGEVLAPGAAAGCALEELTATRHELATTVLAADVASLRFAHALGFVPLNAALDEKAWLMVYRRGEKMGLAA